MLVDSHCHLDFPDLAGDRAEILARARAAGVGTMVTISTRVKRFDDILAIAEAHVDHGVGRRIGAHLGDRFLDTFGSVHGEAAGFHGACQARQERLVVIDEQQ